METKSLIVHETGIEDFYNDIAKDVQARFDQADIERMKTGHYQQKNIRL